MAVVRARSTRQVGRYQLVYELGQAYVGPLWAARAEAADGASQLAILRLMSLAGLDADTRVRLLEAAWQAMEVRHPHVAAVTDVVASDGELGVISEYVEGLPLRSLQGIASVRKRPVPLPVALRIVSDLVDGAVALHDATVELGDEAVPLHGGLSADCLFIGTDGSCRILDVGVASVAGSIPALRRHAERAAYSAPEQLADAPQVDARTDVFAIGVLAWELLSNRRLFLGSDAAVVQKVLSGKIPSLAEVKRRGDPDPPAEVVAAIARALDRSPDARFQTAGELAAALSAAADAVAPRELLASYVRDVADGALARLRDGLRDSKSGPRTATVPREIRMRAGIALPRERPSDARPAGPAAPSRDDLGAAQPAAPPPRKEPPVAPPAAAVAAEAPVMPSPTGLAPPAGERAKPALPLRAPAARHELAAPPPFTSLSPGHAGPRKRQPTMIGIAPPAPTSAPGPEQEGPAARNRAVAPWAGLHVPGAAPAHAEPVKAAAAVEIEPESIPAREVVPTPAGDADDEPTGQYDARELLSHVEAMERQRESVRAPAPDPAAESAALGTFTVARAVPSTFPPPGDPPTAPPATTAAAVATPPPEDGGWLDEAPLSKAPPAHMGPASIAPTSSAPTARRMDRLAAAPVASNPPPAFLPSQIPPPLMHDPRAGRATARPPVARDEKEPEARSVARVALGIAVSLGLVVVSAAVAVLLLRSPEPPMRSPEPTMAPAPPEAPSPAPPPAATQGVAKVAPPAAPSAATVEPEAAAAPSAAPARQAKKPPATVAPAPVAKRKSAPAPRKAAPPKKKRFVPSDI